jgi:L-alanine-DL-glutamate epimerase-like enolase superfamily enzyme
MSTDTAIDKVRVVDLRDWAGPGDDGLFVAVEGAGRTGWYGPIADDAARYIDAFIAEVVVGDSFIDHSVLHKALRQAIGTCANKAGSWAIGAVDCAAWDLHGQVAETPVANLLSPSLISTIPLYASWLRLDLTDSSTLDAVARVGSAGWSFTKWGLRRGLVGDSPVEATRLARAARRVVAALGEAPAFDAIFTWDTQLMMAFVDQFDPAMLLWLEDPLATRDPGAYTDIGEFPLALGERLLVGDNAAALLARRLRAFTLDVVGCGGLTRAVELVTEADAAGVPVFPHGRSLIPAAHLAAAFPQTIPAAEYQLQWEPIRQLLYTEPWLPLEGQLILPRTPGLGLTPRSR